MLFIYTTCNGQQTSAHLPTGLGNLTGQAAAQPVENYQGTQPHCRILVFTDCSQLAVLRPAIVNLPAQTQVNPTWVTGARLGEGGSLVQDSGAAMLLMCTS